MKLKATQNEYKSDSGVKASIWEVTDMDDNLLKKVTFQYETDGSHHVCFYIDYLGDGQKWALIIDNKEWDILCFALDYTPDYIVQVCEDHNKWLENWELVNTNKFEFADWDAAMTVIS